MVIICVTSALAEGSVVYDASIESGQEIIINDLPFKFTFVEGQNKTLLV